MVQNEGDVPRLIRDRSLTCWLRSEGHWHEAMG